MNLRAAVVVGGGPGAQIAHAGVEVIESFIQAGGRRLRVVDNRALVGRPERVQVGIELRYGLVGVFYRDAARRIVGLHLSLFRLGLFSGGRVGGRRARHGRLAGVEGVDLRRQPGLLLR